MGTWDIGDVADYLGIQRLSGGRDSFGVVCPYCGDRRGKMNFCIRKGGKTMNVYHCFHCNASGNMLTLYADLRGLEGPERCKQAWRQLSSKLSSSKRGKEEEAEFKGVEMIAAGLQEKDQVYRFLLDHMELGRKHYKKLEERGLDAAQIKGLHAVSVDGRNRMEGERLARLALQHGLQVRGVPGFFMNRKKNWEVAFPKGSGILFPVPDEEGLYQALQIRMDEEKDGRKYVWLSSTGYPQGVTSKSAAAYFGKMDGEVAVTEGALKAYCAWCFSGKPFIGIPGVGQAACLEPFFREREGTCLRVLECMDMDKWMPVVCDGTGTHCRDCSNGRNGIMCVHKAQKRDNIREGCSRLYRMCREHGIPYRRGTWHMDGKGIWDGSCKGIDDYLYSRKQKAGAA